MVEIDVVVVEEEVLAHFVAEGGQLPGGGRSLEVCHAGRAIGTIRGNRCFRKYVTS